MSLPQTEVENLIISLLQTFGLLLLTINFIIQDVLIISVKSEREIIITKRQPGLPEGWTAPGHDPAGVSNNMC